MRKIFFTIFSLFAISICFSQTRITKDTTFGGWNARISYIDGWHDSSEVFININGLGEVGTDTSKARMYGPHYWQYVNGNDVLDIRLSNNLFRPQLVFVTLQQPSGYQQAQNIKPKCDLIFSRFKAKARARHAMGLSNGGWAWHNFTYYQPSLGDYTYQNYLTSIISLQGQRADDNYGADTYAYPNYFGHGAKNGNYSFFAVEQINDGRGLDQMVKRMIDSVGSNTRFAFFWTNWGSGGHTHFNEMYNPANTNWTLTHPEIQNSNGGAMNTLPIAANQNLYQWALRQGDTSMVTASDPELEVNAGPNKVITLPRSYVYLGGTASHVGHSITSYSWSLVSGPNTPVFMAGSQAKDTLHVNNLIYGTYTFRLTATDDLSNTAFDEVLVNVNADYTCNNAEPVTYTLSETSPGEIYMSNASAQPWKGGDTLKIPTGTYSVIQIDSFGGDPCRNIIIQPIGNVIVTGSLRFQKDAHHFEINGRYGNIRQGITAKNLAVGMVSHATFRNLKLGPNPDGVGIYLKKDPDSAKYYTYYQSYVMRKITVDSCDLKNIEGEGMYIGPTGPNGDVYHSGIVPIRLDSVTVSNCSTDSTGWDGIQVSGALNGAKIFGNTVTNFGLNNIPSQQAGIILGGTTSGNVYNNTVFKGRGNGIQIFGYGSIKVYNNTIDSVGITDNQQSLYGSASGSQVETVPNQALEIYNNLIKNPKSLGAMDFRDDNNNGDTANVHDNYFCIPGAPGNWKTLYLKFAQGNTDTNNVLGCSYPAQSVNGIRGLFKIQQ